MGLTFGMGVLLGAIAIVCIAVGVLMSKPLFWKQFQQRFFNVPLVHTTNWDNPKEMEKILDLLPQLNMSEKEIIIQQLFGRPCRILKGRDESGEWLEHVTFFTNEEAGFHYERTRDRKELG